jgi:hypothetical protein
VLIYNLNHSFCIDISISATSFNLTRNDLSKIDLQVGIINNLMPYWSGDMKLCPTKKHHRSLLQDEDIGSSSHTDAAPDHQ